MQTMERFIQRKYFM